MLRPLRRQSRLTPCPLIRMLTKIMPELPSDDVAAAIAHYRDVLGFRVNYEQDDIGVMAATRSCTSASESDVVGRTLLSAAVEAESDVARAPPPVEVELLSLFES